METNVKRVSSKKDLSDYIKEKKAAIYLGSQTSTVLPFDDLSINIVDLSQMPSNIELDADQNMIIEGPITWKEAKSFCEAHNRQVMVTPTEELALCLSGIATSATGERSFGFGPLRDQILEIEYIDSLGDIKVLNQNELNLNNIDLKEYQKDFNEYQDFKNAPFPRLEKEIDLMIGFEGQLGVITKAKFKTTPKKEEMYLFFPLPKWEENFEAHLEIFESIQGFRNKVTACEFLDWNSMKYLDEEFQLIQDQDLIFIEFDINDLEDIYNDFVSSLSKVDLDKVFEVSFQKCRDFRMAIPRFVQERNQRLGIIKKGTDVQVDKSGFKNLLEVYRSWTEKGIDYNLFGHFGDAHLHFNFLPNSEQVDNCQNILSQFYKDLAEHKASPFAEHGVGLIKQKFIKDFYTENQKRVFKELKEEMDPENLFFPNGFISI